MAGLSRAAHFGVLIKGAKPLEALARIRTLILDKTGTLTDGRPQIVSIDTQGDLSEDEVLYFAAALDQASKHPIAQAIVAAARERGASPFRSPKTWSRRREKALRGRSTAVVSSWEVQVSLRRRPAYRLWKRRQNRVRWSWRWRWTEDSWVIS